MLLQRGVPRDVAEDVVQETAIRLLNNWHLLDNSLPTWPFVRRIALNCLVDRHRSERFETFETLPERAGLHDGEEQGLARFRLTEVWNAMARLSYKERSILLAEVGIVGKHPNSPAAKMARHRARQKLTAAMGRSGAFGGIPVAWRRFTGWLQLHGPNAYLDVGTAAGLMAIVSAAAVTWGSPALSQPGLQRDALKVAHVSERRMERTRESKPLGTRPSRLTKTELPSPSREPTRSARRVPPKPDPASTTAEVGPARAETGRNGGATYVKLCTGEDTPASEDDAEVTITLYDGDQEPDDEAPDCKHEEDKP
jgi:hypothetical protein